MNDIKNLVFDLGGVIVDLEVAPALKEFAGLGLLPEGVSLEQISRQGFPREWPLARLIHRMDCGEIDTPTFFAILRREHGIEASDERLAQAFNRVILLRKIRLEWLCALRKRYRVFLLSNLSDLHWQETRRQALALGIPIEECFDEVFLSYRLRMAKPDPRIFQHLIQTTGIVPGETLYIDDLPDNIEAGARAGLRAHKIESNTLEWALPKLFPELL